MTDPTDHDELRTLADKLDDIAQRAEEEHISGVRPALRKWDTDRLHAAADVLRDDLQRRQRAYLATKRLTAERDAERAARERAEAEARQLREAIGDRHTPEEQQAEVWWGDADHDQRFPHCPSGDDCEGHVTTITVCSECGYTHDGETPIFRQWPCPTLAAAVAEGAEDR